MLDERNRNIAIKVFSEKMIHLKLNPTARLHETVSYESAKPVIYRIVISEKTGRFEKE